jgi:hypothetical protein
MRFKVRRSTSRMFECAPVWSQAPAQSIPPERVSVQCTPAVQCNPAPQPGSLSARQTSGFDMQSDVLSTQSSMMTACYFDALESWDSASVMETGSISPFLETALSLNSVTAKEAQDIPQVCAPAVF